MAGRLLDVAEVALGLRQQSLRVASFRWKITKQRQLSRHRNQLSSAWFPLLPYGAG